MGVTFLPAKARAERIVDADAVLFREVVPEVFQTVARRG